MINSVLTQQTRER